jgi:predicted anti-sigma-YlaC factor YlaD
MGYTTGEGEHVRLQLGVYLLGGLSTMDQKAVADHLSGCDACRAECDELHEVTILLAAVDPEDL